MRWKFISSCVWASPASPTTVRHAPTVLAHSYYRKLQRYQLSIFPLHYFPPFLSHCISLSFHSPFHSSLWFHSGAEKSLWTVDDPLIMVSLSLFLFCVGNQGHHCIWTLSPIFCFLFFLLKSFKASVGCRIIVNLSKYSSTYFYSSHVWYHRSLCLKDITEFASR